jgi:hypothetical protein
VVPSSSCLQAQTLVASAQLSAVSSEPFVFVHVPKLTQGCCQLGRLTASAAK